MDAVMLKPKKSIQNWIINNRSKFTEESDPVQGQLDGNKNDYIL